MPTSIPTSRRCRRPSRGCCTWFRGAACSWRAARARRSSRSWREARCRVLTFGLAPGARLAGGRTSRPGPPARASACSAPGGTPASFTLPLAGEHNVRNALAALAVAAEAGAPPESAAAALAAFRGVKRRLERRGEARGVTVYDDFAHHPTAVRVTLEGAARSRRKRAARGRLRAALVHLADEGVPGRLRARLRRPPTGSIVAAAHLPGKVPEASGCPRPTSSTATNRAGGRAVFLPGVEAIVVGPGAGAPAGGPRGDPLERRLRRDPREAAARALGSGLILRLAASARSAVEARWDLCYKSPAFGRLHASFPRDRPSWSLPASRTVPESTDQLLRGGNG